MTEFIYETKDGKYSFEDTGSWISVWRNGKEWGVPQMDGALRAVIMDLKELKSENARLRGNVISGELHSHIQELIDES
ncbi:hypothetical protein ACFVQB_14225 [Paenibacillus sp. NPDC057886]|uniref:hypothetical protein n=1 Tax=Paenibacillus sp. NPDC057886 TaxID=3346270 RepID=UPI00367783B8